MAAMEIYLDANATTTVLPQARAAALAAMDDDFGNPSSVHAKGLQARARLDAARASARRVLGAAQGRLLFTSGATEGLHTAVLSVLQDLRTRPAVDGAAAPLLLVGATEHKAVPEALRHWNRLLGLGAQIRVIPVGRDGRHDLDWLRQQAPQAALVCTMAANNETGVISDLDGIGAALQGSRARWLVDGVQALGKLPLQLDRPRAGRCIDYACFSGHKLHAPKGIGLLYVHGDAPFTPMTTGGGQEQGQRAGTENMPGIAALGAVLAALEQGDSFHDAATLAALRQRLATALQQALPGLVFNAPPALCVPTTLNVSLPGTGAARLMALLQQAGLAASGGSACSAGQAKPSDVLVAMGLPWDQGAGAVRLSFGAADDPALIDRACARLQAHAPRWHQAALRAQAAAQAAPAPPARLTRFMDNDHCCYALADISRRQAWLIDARPALVPALQQWLDRHGLALQALWCSTGDAATATAAESLQQTRGLPAQAQGWPADVAAMQTGAGSLSRLPLPAGTAYRLQHEGGLVMVFAGDAASAGEPGHAELHAQLPPQTLLLPRRDPARRWAWLLGGATAPGETEVAIASTQLSTLDSPWRVDLRDADERLAADAPQADQHLPMAELLDGLPEWLARPRPLVFGCRSGQRSTQAARLLRRLGHQQAWSLAGGLLPRA